VCSDPLLQTVTKAGVAETWAWSPKRLRIVATEALFLASSRPRAASIAPGRDSLLVAFDQTALATVFSVGAPLKLAPHHATEASNRSASDRDRRGSIIPPRETSAARPSLFAGWRTKDYYLLERDRAHYANYTGTGNTLNANRPIVRRLILDSVRYWVTHMHVDGFRFDLASVLDRDETGAPMPNPPVILDIESDPVLAGTKMIAEAWDAGGLYQVGSFVGDAWQEWNGKFRDDVRGFVKSDNGTVSKVAARLLGSPDIYGHENRGPEQSINFVTCHDGFTLNDLVSYDRKHNDDNGENNRDGIYDNLSWNCGVEGPSSDPGIEALRLRQIKNFVALTFIAVGTPMLLMGDEVRRTQRGNNNAYCQDNEISWLDWGLADRNAELHRFVKMMIEFRRRRDVVVERAGLAGLTQNQLLAQARLTWHGIALNSPDPSEDSHSIAFAVTSLRETFTIYVMLNAYWEPLTFQLPQPDNYWRRWVDTSLVQPGDISAWEEAPPVSQSRYGVGPRSLAFLIDTGRRTRT
jgi:isoamylase